MHLQQKIQPAINDDTLFLPGLSPVGRHGIHARFDGGALPSDGGVLLLREIERGVNFSGMLASCLQDARDPGRTIHDHTTMIRERMFVIACGYEDCDDLDALRHDPAFRIACEHLPDSGPGLASQPIHIYDAATDRPVCFLLRPGKRPSGAEAAMVQGTDMHFGAAMLVGLVDGVGVAYFDVSPFIMTLGVSSVGAGLALFLTGGVPVSGLPFAFGDNFGFGRVAGVPVPVIIALVCILIMWIFMSRTRLGTQVYAVGGNIKAARLSAINTKRTLVLAYTICALVAPLAGLLLTARVDSGEANLGGTIALESIAACVIAGVLLRGGIGRVENVVLGAFFIVLVQNGMNLAQISSYMQMVLLGLLLILAVIFDQLRCRIILSGA